MVDNDLSWLIIVKSQGRLRVSQRSIATVHGAWWTRPSMVGSTSWWTWLSPAVKTPCPTTCTASWLWCCYATVGWVGVVWQYSLLYIAFMINTYYMYIYILQQYRDRYYADEQPETAPPIWMTRSSSVFPPDLRVHKLRAPKCWCHCAMYHQQLSLVIVVGGCSTVWTIKTSNNRGLFIRPSSLLLVWRCCP